jgi:ferritin-like metal-binding protein YciE
MKGQTMSMNDLEDLFLHDLKDTYDAEKRLTKALPKMAKAASSKKLQQAFHKHFSVTKLHVERLERIFKLLKQPARGKKCVGMTGLVEEGSELMSENGSDAARDAGLIGAAQKVEHYEIAAYGTMATYAEMLGLAEAERLLKQTLAEEKQTDKELTQLASTINFEAEMGNGKSVQATAASRSRAKKSTREDSARSKSNGRGSARRGKLLGRVKKVLSGWVGK